MAINRILLAYDGSTFARKALEQVRDLALLARAEVEVLLVLQPEHLADVSKAMTVSHREQAEREAQGATDEAKTFLAANGITATSLILLGHPAEEILKRAEAAGFDLIALGSRGLGAIPRFVMGSVSSRVVTHAHCSVLVVKS